MPKYLVLRTITLSMIVDADTAELAKDIAEKRTPTFQGHATLLDDLNVWDMDGDDVEVDPEPRPGDK